LEGWGMTKEAEAAVAEVLRLIEQKTQQVEKCRRWAAEAATAREQRRWLDQAEQARNERRLIHGGLLALELALEIDVADQT
jgi:hypothetical protein